LEFPGPSTGAVSTCVSKIVKIQDRLSYPMATLQRMAVPEIIPIMYEPDYHRGTIRLWSSMRTTAAEVLVELGGENR
jgi:hypothetical protein